MPDTGIQKGCIGIAMGYPEYGSYMGYVGVLKLGITVDDRHDKVCI